MWFYVFTLVPSYRLYVILKPHSHFVYLYTNLKAAFKHRHSCETKEEYSICFVFLSVHQTNLSLSAECCSVIQNRKQACVLYLYLGWSPSLSSAEAAPTLWPGAAPSATSHSHSSPFSDREREETVMERESGEIRESQHLHRCRKPILKGKFSVAVLHLYNHIIRGSSAFTTQWNNSKRKKKFPLFSLDSLNALFSGLQHTWSLHKALVSFRGRFMLRSTYQFVKLHLQVFLLYIDASVSTESLVHILRTLWRRRIWPEELQWWQIKTQWKEKRRAEINFTEFKYLW